MEQTGEVDGLLLVGGMVGVHLDELGVTDDVLQSVHANLGQVFAHLLSEEGEEVHHIVRLSTEAGTQGLVLRSHTHRAGVGVALAHHHTAEHDERQRAEGELVGAEHSHQHHVLGGLQLTVGLETHLITQTVEHKRLLCLSETDLGRDAGKAHGAGRAGTRTAFRAADDDEVGLGLGNTGSDGAHAAFGHELHADCSGRIDILEIEDELSQVFDTVDVMMRWGRDERDAGDGITRLGDDLVDLEARQLTALTGLGALSDLDLNLLGIHEVFSGHAETATGNLLGLRAEAHAIHVGVVAHIVLTAFTRVASSTQLVHGQCQSLVRLDTQRTERHGARDEVLHDALHRLDLVDRGRLRCLLPSEEVADEDRLLLRVHHLLPLLELLVRTQARGNLEVRNRVGIPSVEDAVLAV